MLASVPGRGRDVVLLEIGRVEAEIEAAEREFRQAIVEREIHALDVDASEIAGRLVDEVDLTPGLDRLQKATWISAYAARLAEHRSSTDCAPIGVMLLLR